MEKGKTVPVPYFFFQTRYSSNAVSKVRAEEDSENRHHPPLFFPLQYCNSSICLNLWSSLLFHHAAEWHGREAAPLHPTPHAPHTSLVPSQTGHRNRSLPIPCVSPATQRQWRSRWWSASASCGEMEAPARLPFGGTAGTGRDRTDRTVPALAKRSKVRIFEGGARHVDI